MAEPSFRPLTCVPCEQVGREEDVKDQAVAVNTMLEAFQSQHGRPANAEEARIISAFGHVPPLTCRIDLDMRAVLDPTCGGKRGRPVRGNRGDLTLHWSASAAQPRVWPLCFRLLALRPPRTFVLDVTCPSWPVCLRVVSGSYRPCRGYAGLALRSKRGKGRDS